MSNAPGSFRSARPPVRSVLGRNIYTPVIDEANRITRVGDLVIGHASSRRLPPLVGLERMVVTEEILDRLKRLHGARLDGRSVLVEGEPGAVKTQTLRLYSHLARLDFIRLNGFPEADETDFMGGDKPIAPGIIRPLKGFLPTVAEAPAMGLLDEISRFRPEILPSVLNDVLDYRRVKRQVGKDRFEEIPWNDESFLAGTLNGRHHLGSHALPPDTRDRFLPQTWDNLPEIEEKQIACVLYDLPEDVVTASWNFHEAIERATGPGTNLEYPIRPFSRRDFHRLTRFTRYFAAYHGEDLMRSAYANAIDVYLSRIPSAADRLRLQDAFMDSAFSRDSRPANWPPVEMRLEGNQLTIGDATETIVPGVTIPDDIEETPFTLNLMRLSMKARASGTHLFFRGPSGIGKSANARHGLWRRGSPFQEQHFKRGMGGDDLMGRYFGGDQKGELRFGTTPLRLAMSEGVPYLADEVDNAKSEGIQLLLSVLDEGRLVMSQGPEEGVPVVVAQPGFVFQGTLNPFPEYKGIRYVGKSPLVGTILDRGWEVFTDYKDQTEERDELIRIQRRKLKGSPEADAAAEKMVDFFLKLEEEIDQGNIDNKGMDREMPTKRWLIEWAKTSMKRFKANTSYSILAHLGSAATTEIAGRFRGEDRIKVESLLFDVFPDRVPLEFMTAAVSGSAPGGGPGWTEPWWQQSNP